MVVLQTLFLGCEYCIELLEDTMRIPFLGGLGVPELIIILLVVLLIFGPKNLPKLGSAIGRTVKSLRDGMEDRSDKSKKAEEPEAEAQTQAQAEAEETVYDYEAEVKAAQEAAKTETQDKAL